MRFLFGNYSHKKTDDLEQNIEKEFDVVSPTEQNEPTSIKNSPSSRTIPPLEIIVDNQTDINEKTPLLSTSDGSPKINYDTLPLMSPRRINHMLKTSVQSCFNGCKSLLNNRKEMRLADYCKENLVDENQEMRSFEVLSPCKTQPVIITFFYDTFLGVKWRVNGVRMFNMWFSANFFRQKDFRIECVNVKLMEETPNVVNEMRKEGSLPITPHDGLLIFTRDNEKMKCEPFDLYLFYYVMKKL